MWDLVLNSYEGIVKNCKSCEECCIFHGSGKLCFYGIHTPLLLIAFVLSRGAASQLEIISSQFCCWTIKAGKTIFFKRNIGMSNWNSWKCIRYDHVLQQTNWVAFFSQQYEKIPSKIFLQVDSKYVVHLKRKQFVSFRTDWFYFWLHIFLFCTFIFLYFLASFQDNTWNFRSEKKSFQ